MAEQLKPDFRCGCSGSPCKSIGHIIKCNIEAQLEAYEKEIDIDGFCKCPRGFSYCQKACSDKILKLRPAFQGGYEELIERVILEARYRKANKSTILWSLEQLAKEQQCGRHWVIKLALHGAIGDIKGGIYFSKSF